MKSIATEKAKHLRSFDLSCALHVLQRLFPGSQIEQLSKLDKGLSNHNFYFKLDAKPCLLKAFNGAVPVTALNAQNALAQQQVSQAILCLDRVDNVAVLEFLTAVQAPICLEEQIPKLLSGIHNLSVEKSTQLNLKGAILEASSLLEQTWLGEYLIDELSALPSDICFCHNDLVQDNVLNTPHGVRMLDFEYAQYNDSFFDLAAICCSYQLNEKQRQALLERYFFYRRSPNPDNSIYKLDVFRGIYLLVSIAWYKQKNINTEMEMLEKQFKPWCRQHNLVYAS
ncbi:phosphotransferase [Pseudoalteromonas obscura]|uniref:Phosphotransferase n=1 Tax=Pseudoalteromonas obscura TaxID=3048491 RepID=A0ABT7EUL5_9GAMM|nr:phosphotransferase [Pseudoalteromonas sp. P94(2023)]MDK2598679.1 phosphotransferase [Pseudoalteromonas sp. P94(2023)]